MSLKYWISTNGADEKFFGVDRWPTVTIGGVTIYPDRNCPDTRTRSWRERLFTLPWRPLKKTELHDLVYYITTGPEENDKFGLTSYRVFWKLKKENI